MSAVRKQLYYLWKKLSERQSRKKFEQDNNKDDIKRFKNATDKKQASRIGEEMKALQRYWGCYPYQYYRYDFYRMDCALTIEEMRQYVPHFFIMSLFFPLSYKDYGVLCEDKLMTYAILKAYEVPQPKLLFCFDQNLFFDCANNPLSYSESDTLITTCPASKLFVKPRFGLGGRGIEVFNKVAENGFLNRKGTVLNHEFFINEVKDNFYIVQEGLEQHQALNDIYPHSVNTFRIMTECINGQARVLYALVRMGSGGQQIDNASSGGLYIKIDPETGVLAHQAFAFNRRTFEKHPDTGFVFKGAKMKIWTEAKRFTLAAAQKFREIKYMGWDIAFTTNGPSVIELNNAPGIGIIQDCYGGIRDDMKINPKDWWYQSNYTIKNL
jgi:hypothetical protein